MKKTSNPQNFRSALLAIKKFGLRISKMTKPKKKRKRKTISTNDHKILWGKSAGRCQFQGCGEILWRDSAAAHDSNNGDVVHIVAASPDGPRGSKGSSEKLDNDPSNLMLMCGKHHRLIDRKKNPDYSIEELQEMKKNHEDKVEYLTELLYAPKIKIIIYSGNIGEHNSSIDIITARETLVSEGLFPLPNSVNFSLGKSRQEDTNKFFWKMQLKEIETTFKKEIKPYLEEPDFLNLAFFGLAPIPLLIKAGALLSDIKEVQVRQLMKEPKTWKWDSEGEPLNFDILKPKPINQTKEIALVLSISAEISHDRVTKVLPNADIWEIRASKINNDNVRVERSLEEFRITFREALADIKKSYQGTKTIHVFPSVAVSIATEMGRAWNKKSDLSLRIYDNNNNSKNKGFQPAISIK